MARLSTCVVCGSKLKKEEKFTYSNKTHCKKCYELKLLEKSEYEDLIKNICEYYKIQSPTGLMLKQIKDYKEQFNYTYAGISYTLWYCKEILRKKLDAKYGLALIRYEYINAEAYFINQQAIQKSIQESNKKDNEVIIEKICRKESSRKKYLLNLDDFLCR